MTLSPNITPHFIYSGSIYHNRLTPQSHAFVYPAFFFGIDLDQLDALSRTRFIRHNRAGLFSIYDRDYLDAGDEPLAAKCRRFLGTPASRILMITVPRIMGYAFNPVSFYLGYDHGGSITSMLAEVNNTFGERHVYVLREPDQAADGSMRFTSDKAFHVSPFNDRLGQYVFRIKQRIDSLEIHVDIERNGTVVFKSGIMGKRRAPLSDAAACRCLLRYPMQNILTLPRIHWQAAKLYFQKKLSYYPKPGPMSPMTIKIAPPNLLERVGIKLFQKLASRISTGKISVTMPDSSTTTYGDPHAAASESLIVRDYTFFRRILLDGDIGLGESHMLGQWDSQDLTGTISLLIRNRDSLENGEFWTTRLKWLLHRVSHTKRSNTKTKSRSNIQAHYDLSNDFFQLFLDPTMMYSSAIFQSPGQALEEAQHHRMDVLISKLNISPSDHVLEIGSGWGGFAIEMAKKTGCRVTSITISDEQLALARKRVADAGLEGRVQIEHRDYRDVKGTYDRIVSIEMLEAVGHEHFDSYFGAINRALKAGGCAVVQVITIPEARYEAYLNSVDWIQKHIFPGGHLPCIEALQDSMRRVSDLVITGTEDIGLHYAETLRRWSQNLAMRKQDLLAMGFDEVFYRKWQYYFSYCEAAFATRTLSDMHLIIERK